MLTSCIGQDGRDWNFKDYESVEALDFYDCVDEEVGFDDDDLEEQYERESDESDDEIDLYDWLEEHGYKDGDINYIIEGGIIAYEYNDC